MLKKYIPHISLSVLFAVVGTVVGVTISPNYIKVHVDQVGKLSLGPDNGDVIEWDGLDGDDNPFDVSISFAPAGSDAPCNPIRLLKKGICIVSYPDPNGTYLYDCKNNPGNPVCGDPNLGPSSSTGGGHATIPLFKRIVGGYRVLLQHLFAVSKFSRNAVYLDVGQVPPSGFNASLSARSVPTYAQVDCNGGNPNTTQVTQTGHSPNDPITVSVGDSILWGGPHGPKGFTLSGLSNVCTMKGKACTVNSGTNGETFTYTAQDSKCAANPNEQIIVNP